MELTAPPGEGQGSSQVEEILADRRNHRSLLHWTLFYEMEKSSLSVCKTKTFPFDLGKVS